MGPLSMLFHTQRINRGVSRPNHPFWSSGSLDLDTHRASPKGFPCLGKLARRHDTGRAPRLSDPPAYIRLPRAIDLHFFFPRVKGVV